MGGSLVIIKREIHCRVALKSAIRSANGAAGMLWIKFWMSAIREESINAYNNVYPELGTKLHMEASRSSLSWASSDLS